MQLTDIFLSMGQDAFAKLLRSISLGKLKTFQLFERIKTRLHVNKLNSEALRKAAPKSWARIEAREEEFASEIAQAVLISHMDMIQAVLNHLEIPHEDGFFAKDAEIADKFTDGWQARAWDQFKDTYPREPLLFYINHLGWEVAQTQQVFAPAA